MCEGTTPKIVHHSRKTGQHVWEDLGIGLVEVETNQVRLTFLTLKRRVENRLKHKQFKAT